jgi:hypothetical protein
MIQFKERGVESGHKPIPFRGFGYLTLDHESILALMQAAFRGAVVL